MDGLFDNPMAGMDLDGLSFGKPGGAASSIPDEDQLKQEGEGDDIITDEPIVDDIDRSTALHQGLEIPEEEELPTDDEVDLLKIFTEQGIISLGEDEEVPEDADLEWFTEKARTKVQADVDSAIEEYKETLPEEVRFLLDNYEQGVSIADLARTEKQVREVSSISEEDLLGSDKLQKDLLSKYLKISGESDEDIKEMILDYEDSGLLEKMSKKAHTRLISYEKSQKENLIKQQKEAELSRKQQYNTWLSELKTTIDSKDEILPGVTLTDKQKKDLYKGITQTDKDGKNAVMKYRESNPDFDLQVAYLATVLKGDFSVFENLATTKATKKVKEQANSLNSMSSKSGKKLKGVDLSIMKQFLKS